MTRWLLLACVLFACGDKKVMPKNVRVSADELTAALEAGDLHRICSVMPLVKTAVLAWEKDERDGVEIPGVTGRRARSLALEGRQLSDWDAACREDRLDLKTHIRWKHAWASSAANLQMLGRIPGHQRTAQWLLFIGIAVAALLLAAFVIAFRLRDRDHGFPNDDDDG